jgi:hypothetical protein
MTSRRGIFCNRLQELWRNSPYADQRPISYMVITECDAAQEVVLQSRGVHPVVLIHERLRGGPDQQRASAAAATNEAIRSEGGSNVALCRFR